MKILFFAVMLFLFIGLSLPQPGQAQEALYGRPARLRDLTGLDLVTKNDLTAPQKTEVMLSWLVAERNHPSPTTTGVGGSPIDTDYIQAQIVKGLEVGGDPNAVSWVLTSASLEDESIRNAMSLVLGSMGDRSQIRKIEDILLNEENPYLRAIAAEDLGILGSVGSIKVLEKASKDQFSLTFASEAHEGKMIIFYPVRRVAQETLRVLCDPILLKSKLSREQFFTKRLTDAQTYAHKYNIRPERFTKIAARSKRTVKASPSG